MAPRVHEVVHQLRQKPQHVRENIAIGVSVGVTLVVAIAWFTANAASGTFSLGGANTTLASSDAAQGAGAVADSAKSNFSQLLGAADAAVGATTSPATIEVVDTQVHSTLDQDQNASDQTVIHF